MKNISFILYCPFAMASAPPGGVGAVGWTTIDDTGMGGGRRVHQGHEREVPVHTTQKMLLEGRLSGCDSGQHDPRTRPRTPMPHHSHRRNSLPRLLRGGGKVRRQEQTRGRQLIWRVHRSSHGLERRTHSSHTPHDR